MSTPIHPRDFRRMTPRQRDQLAARRRREVREASRRTEGVDLTPLLDLIAPLVAPTETTCLHCDKPARGRGMCNMHYKRWARFMESVRGAA